MKESEMNFHFIRYLWTYDKGVGEGGWGARASPLSKVGGTSGFVPLPSPPHFWAEQMF